MKATAEKSGTENQRRASAEGVARTTNGASPFAAHSAGRPEAIAQRRLIGLANQSAQAKSTAGHQSRLNAAPGVVALQRKQQAASRGAKGGELSDNLQETKGVQRKAAVDAQAPVQREAEPTRTNRTGLPDALKAGVESLSGVSLDDVRVHYNSAKPAQLQALAYTQGSEIHVAPGQERHLPHEAWHAVQQKQGRVRATAQLKGVGLNDTPALEAEADAMGARAIASDAGGKALASQRAELRPVEPVSAGQSALIQRVYIEGIGDTKWMTLDELKERLENYANSGEDRIVKKIENAIHNKDYLNSASTTAGSSTLSGTLSTSVPSAPQFNASTTASYVTSSSSATHMVDTRSFDGSSMPVPSQITRLQVSAPGQPFSGEQQSQLLRQPQTQVYPPRTRQPQLPSVDEATPHSPAVSGTEGWSRGTRGQPRGSSRSSKATRGRQRKVETRADVTASETISVDKADARLVAMPSVIEMQSHGAKKRPRRASVSPRKKQEKLVRGPESTTSGKESQLVFISSNGKQVNITPIKIVQKLHEWMIQTLRSDDTTTHKINLNEYWGHPRAYHWTENFDGGFPRPARNVSELYAILVESRRAPKYALKLQSHFKEFYSQAISSNMKTKKNSGGKLVDQVIRPPDNLSEFITGKGVAYPEMKESFEKLASPPNSEKSKNRSKTEVAKAHLALLAGKIPAGYEEDEIAKMLYHLGVMAVAEPRRNVGVFPFVPITLQNIADGKITVDQAFGGIKDELKAFPPAWHGSKGPLELIDKHVFEGKELGAASTQQAPVRRILQKMEKQIEIFFESRGDFQDDSQRRLPGADFDNEQDALNAIVSLLRETYFSGIPAMFPASASASASASAEEEPEMRVKTRKKYIRRAKKRRVLVEMSTSVRGLSVEVLDAISDRIKNLVKEVSPKQSEPNPELETKGYSDGAAGAQASSEDSGYTKGYEGGTTDRFRTITAANAHKKSGGPKFLEVIEPNNTAFETLMNLYFETYYKAT